MIDDITYQDIVERLKDMADRIAEDCIPDGRREGNDWSGNLHGKMSVCVRGQKRGIVAGWQGQFGNKTGSNLIGLIELAFGCKSHGEAVRLAKEKYLGIGKRELTPEEKRRWAQQQEESRRRAERRQRDAERLRAEKIETVHSIWQEAVPIPGTLAEDYLRTRWIELSDFPAWSAWPQSLRFHPGLRHGGERHPGLIGGVQDKARKLIAIWRILLGSDGKALLDSEGKKVKVGFGPAMGGAVRLAPAGPVLRLAEGLETALGVMALTACRAPVWSTLSTSGMIRFQIPDGVRRIEIYADGDRSRENTRTGGVLEPPGIKAAKQLQERALKEGIEAVVCPSPEPDDWLDVWIQRKRDERRERQVQYL